MNQFFDFPQELDLTPYSYHEVMEKEGHNKQDDEKKEGEADDEEKKEEDGKEEEEENPIPILDDCFEYTLAGVTVHSGTANAGHYWSYISTERDGLRSNPDKPVDHENAKWMEFNDSYVREWDLSKLKKETYGGEQSNSWSTVGLSSFDGWGSMGGGGSYGQSGYMLFYERKKKKPIKLVDFVEETNAEGEVEKKEHIREVPYNSCVDISDRPNKIFNQVLDLNSKFGFEQEIYQPEFFEFIYGIQKAISNIDSDSERIQVLRRHAIELANKATLEIYASAKNCNKIEKMFQVMGEVMHHDKTLTLHREYLQYWFEQDKFSYLYQLLLENPEQQARVAFGKFMRYLLVTVKMADKEFLGELEEFSVYDEQGKEFEMVREKSLAARFVLTGMDMFNNKVAKFWQRMDQFLEVLYYFGVADTADVEAWVNGDPQNIPTIDSLDTTGEGARVGLKFFAKKSLIQHACDFILGNKSPLCRADERRHEVGNYSMQPDYSHIMRLVVLLLDDKELS